jgi:hypothetical protein
MSEEWRKHPRLQGRFHLASPDDVQVIVHDGGPRLRRLSPEVVWVRIVAGEGDVFVGNILNQPAQLTSLAAGNSIHFKVPESGELPIMVTERYLLERDDWSIQPCGGCGLTELFDVPSDLITALFPPGPEQFVPEIFTTFCGWCGGVQVVQRADPEDDASASSPAKRWWELWR